MSTLYLSDNVTNLTDLYYQDINLVNIPSLKANNVTECYRMFQGCTNIQSIGQIDFPNCNNFRAAFTTCSNLNTLPIQPKDFKNNTDYAFLYHECINLIFNLNDVDVSDCGLEGVFRSTNIRNINNCTFTNCNLNTTFRLTNMLYSMYNTNIINCTMYQTFWHSATTNKGIFHSIDNCKFENISTFQTFMQCENLVEVNNTSINNTHYTQYMFTNCYNLTYLNDFSINNVHLMSYMFDRCRALIDIPILNLDNTTNMVCTFRYCNNLSVNAYANIANSLPLANNLSNQYISNIGLNISNFTSEQISILNNKGYIDAIPVEPIISDDNSYTVTYSLTNKELYDTSYYNDDEGFDI